MAGDEDQGPLSGAEMRRIVAWFSYAHVADLLFVESVADKTVGELRAALRSRMRREMAEADR